MTYAVVLVSDGDTSEGMLVKGGQPDGAHGALSRMRQAVADALNDGAYYTVGMAGALWVALEHPRIEEIGAGDDAPHAMFRYRVLPSRGTPDAVYVVVDGRTLPGGGEHTWTPLGAFLVFSTRLRAVRLTLPDQAIRSKQQAYPECVAAVERATVAAPPILGDDYKDFAGAVEPLRRAAAFMQETGLANGSDAALALLARADSAERRAAAVTIRARRG